MVQPNLLEYDHSIRLQVRKFLKEFVAGCLFVNNLYISVTDTPISDEVYAYNSQRMHNRNIGPENALVVSVDVAYYVQYSLCAWANQGATVLSVFMMIDPIIFMSLSLWDAAQ